MTFWAILQPPVTELLKGVLEYVILCFVFYKPLKIFSETVSEFRCNPYDIHDLKHTFGTVHCSPCVKVMDCVFSP